MQETRNNCFGLKKCSMTFLQARTGKQRVPKCNSNVRCCCILAFVLRFVDPKQLLRVSCILWYYYPKCYSIILENASLWCFIVIITEKWAGEEKESEKYHNKETGQSSYDQSISIYKCKMQLLTLMKCLVKSKNKQLCLNLKTDLEKELEVLVLLIPQVT